MRAVLLSTLIVALLSSTSGMAGEPATTDQTKGNIEPVLVRVDTQGKVTDVSPAYPLSHSLMRVLRANLDQMIHKPATDKQGKPIPSQFIIEVALKSEQTTSGEYAAHFAYVSARPVPAGSWYWAHDPNGQLVLSSQDNLSTMRPFNAGSNMINGGTTSTPISSGGGGRGR
ncbi:hypothetical protein DWU98_16605 [Dyella monticola]|uniref:Uncharacterized protein n=1 Tax=Dyella monticola TaxID=1927958 RepID=A0A370WUN5_9GAMM|nr:hypothetical protein [Dyella monticola]RDS79685.1 hypothetical protein DWU98_16605 [Dyella monticola]